MKIKIDNPIQGGARVTSERSAQHYVDQGRAKWTTPKSICFAPTDHRHIIAQVSITKATILGYDRVDRMLTRREMRSIPIVQLDRALRT